MSFDLIIFCVLILVFAFFIVNNLCSWFPRVLKFEIRWRLDKLAVAYCENKRIRRLLLYDDLITFFLFCVFYILEATGVSSNIWIVFLLIIMLQFAKQIVLLKILESLKAGE